MAHAGSHLATTESAFSPATGMVITVGSNTIITGITIATEIFATTTIVETTIIVKQCNLAWQRLLKSTQAYWKPIDGYLTVTVLSASMVTDLVTGEPFKGTTFTSYVPGLSNSPCAKLLNSSTWPMYRSLT